MLQLRAILASVVIVHLSTVARADTPPADGPVDYLTQVKPILTRRCYSCHGPLKHKGDLRLDTAKAMLDRGGDGEGGVVIAGNSAESLLVLAITHAAGVTPMPDTGGPLEPAEIDLIRRWIDQGAAAPADEKPAADPRDHWAFQPPVRPALPDIDDPRWAAHPVDRFIADAHRSRGLTPRPEADKRTLIRRLYLDLIGLPPTPAQVSDFINDSSPDAYTKVVDQLLASPQYGERWARHWMDVWRYSDWYGYQQELRNSARHIWRWRDWIIESLNEDKPYNRMIVEMLAADEVAPDDPAALRATGFLARNYYKFNRNVWLDDAIEHTAKAMLGVTMNCARCHDHMYDPISQVEYYQFRAFFEPYEVRIDRVPGSGTNTDVAGLSRVYDAKADAPTYLFVRGNEKDPDKEHPLSPSLPEALANRVGGAETLSITPVSLPTTAYYPGLRQFERDETLASARAEVAKQTEALKAVGDALSMAVAEKQLAAAEASLKAVESRLAADAARYCDPPADNFDALAKAANDADRRARLAEADAALAVASKQLADAQAKKDEKAIDAANKQRDEAQKKLNEVYALLAKPTAAEYKPFGPIHPSTSTGRRAALARWIASDANPLTARVAVNHLWMRHLGEPLVPTVFDFGLNGKPPTHPQLLDWMAVELMQHNWSFKHLHKLIVTSATYRMRSDVGAVSQANLAADPDNHLLWRMNVRRMEAEVVRDSLLQLAGQLDTAMGGPELDQNSAMTARRRSVYFRHAHEKYVPFMQLFDGASVTECYRRARTVVPQQALALANSPLALTQSRVLAGELSKQAGEDEAGFIAAAFEHVLARPATDAEREHCATFLAEQAKLLADPTQLTAFTSGTKAEVAPAADPRQRARENLVHVLFNHNDFVTIR